MTFFYDLNKKLDEIRATPELTHGQLNERDMSRAAKGYEKYGKQGMQALAKAGREGKDLDSVRKKYDKYDEAVEEGAYQGGPDKSQIPAVNRPGNKLTTADLKKERTQSPTSAEGMRALQDRLSKINPMDEADMEEGNRFIKAVVDAKADGIQPGEKINVGGKEYPVKEAAKWRDPKFKDKLYTQEPRDYDQYDYGDDDYYNPKPADYPGEKNLKGGGEFDHNDPLQKGQGIGRSGIKNNILDRGPRKGLPSRDQITSLKGSIKSARGTHARPNLPEASTKKTVMPQTGKKPNTNESIKLIAVKEGAGQTVKVYCDTAYDEFHVRVFSKGQEVVESRYFTQSQDDAITTADYMVEGAFTMAPKQKFADKIAVAKQEVDEMLGDVAAEAMKSALSGRQKTLDKNNNGKLDANDFAMLRKGSKQKTAEATGSINFDKVLDAVAALYGDDMWHNDSMQDVAHDLEQQQPTDQELNFIIAKGRLPKRLANTQFTNNDSVKFGEASDDNSPFTAHKRPRVEQPKRGSVEQGSKHDIKHDTTDPKYSGRIAIRRVDPSTGHSVGTDDDKPGEKRGRGRPGGKGAGKSIGAKGPSGKSKLMTREGPDDIQDQGEYDQEGDMALDDINTIESAANELQSIIDANDNLPEWVQSKINKAMDYLDTARDYMSAQEDDEQIVEKAVSKKQQKFMGMVHAAQKGKKPASKEVGKVAKSMGKKDAEDFASTKHKGLPNKVKEESTDKEDQKAERAGKRVAKDIEHDEGHKGRDDNRAEKAGKRVTKDIEYDDKKDRKEKKKDEVEENTVAGSVAPAMGGKASKGSGGMTFGKGVYESTIAESFNSKLKTVLNEGMSVNMSADQDGKKSLTVTATDDDAVKLSQLLNLAGIGGQSQGYDSVCPGCGSSDCGCDQMQEDLANSAENTMYTDTDYMVNGLSGGLDGQKTDQSTLGTVINQDPRRTIGSVAESNDVVELYKRIA